MVIAFVPSLIISLILSVVLTVILNLFLNVMLLPAIVLGGLIFFGALALIRMLTPV